MGTESNEFNRNINTYNEDGSDGIYDDGPYDPDWQPENEDPWGSLKEYSRSNDETPTPPTPPEDNRSREQRAVDEFVDDLDNIYAETMEAQAKETAELRHHLEEMKGKPDDFFNPDADVYYNGGSGEFVPANPKEAGKYDHLNGKKRSFGTFDLNPRQKGESSKDYGERLFDGYALKVVAQHFERDVNGKEPETQEHYQARIKDFMSRYPRLKTESVDQYEKRIDGLFKSGIVDAFGNETKTDSSTDQGFDDSDNPNKPQPMGDPGDKPNEPNSATDAPNNPDNPEDGNPTGEDTPNKNSVKIGEIQLDGINEKFEKIDQEKMDKLEKDLGELLNNKEDGLAELYARNRRLFVGAENKRRFGEVQKKYGKLLDEYLQPKAKHNKATRSKEINDGLGDIIDTRIEEIKTKLTEFAGGDLENTEKTQEELNAEKERLINEANEALRQEYGEDMDKIKSAVNADFLNDLITEQIKMEKATIDKLNNGTVCRKIVHNVINNKYIKGVLVAAGLAGLAVTGVGVATGAVALGYSLTAGGIAAGAAKGAGSGLFMSRQDAKNSAIKGFGDGETVKQEFANIDILAKGNNDIANTAQWIMEQYTEASKEDRRTNIKKTAISAGLGAAIGGAMSGVHFNTVTKTPGTTTELVGYEPDQIRPQFTDIIHKQGTGMNELFREMGGQGDLPTDILNELSEEFGLELGKSGWTYPGSVSEWPSVNQAMFESLTNKCIARGLIPTTRIPGEAIYNTVTTMVEKTIPDQFRNFIVRGLEAVIPAGIGGVIGGIRERAGSKAPSESDNTTVTPENPSSESLESSETSEAPEAPEAKPESNTTEIEGRTDESARAEEARRSAENAYAAALQQAQTSLGGIENLKYFINNGFSDEEYYDYWQGLSDEGRAFARTILQSVPAEQRINWDLGKDFMDWLAYYDEATNS